MNTMVDQPAPKTRPANLPTGTPVWIRGVKGAWKVTAVTGWRAPSYQTPSGYRLLAWKGCGFREATPDELKAIPEAEIPPPPGPYKPPPNPFPWIDMKCLPTDLAERIRNPETLPGLLAELEHRKVEIWRRKGFRGRVNQHLSTSAKLNDLFRQAHCHSCWNDLDNYTYDECPDCGWIKCPCGGCGCNWPGRDGNQPATRTRFR